LPPYAEPELIERLWGPQATVIANVLFETMDDLVAAFRRASARSMVIVPNGIMFDP